MQRSRRAAGEGDDVREFAGGGPDGIFAVRVRGLAGANRFRIGVGPGT